MQIPTAPVETLLCGIAKDEDRYIAEWIEYHLAIGFKTIAIYDNDSVNHASAFVPISAAPRVIVRRWPTQAGVSPQLSAYQDAFRRYRDGLDWMMFLDLDEFLNLKLHASLSSFLADFPSADGVAINWRMFGSAGHLAHDGRPVLTRFPRASRAAWTGNYLVKTIFRPKSVIDPAIHSPLFDDGALLVNPSGAPLDLQPNALQKNIDLRVAQVNHYFLKSLEEFQLKLRRGRADVADGDPAKFRDEGSFAAYDRNEEEDTSILRHLT